MEYVAVTIEVIRFDADDVIETSPVCEETGRT